MNGDVQVRLCERLEGRFPGATRLLPKPQIGDEAGKRTRHFIEFAIISRSQEGERNVDTDYRATGITAGY